MLQESSFSSCPICGKSIAKSLFDMHVHSCIDQPTPSSAHPSTTPTLPPSRLNFPPTPHPLPSTSTSAPSSSHSQLLPVSAPQPPPSLQRLPENIISAVETGPSPLERTPPDPSERSTAPGSQPSVGELGGGEGRTADGATPSVPFGVGGSEGGSGGVGRPGNGNPSKAPSVKGNNAFAFMMKKEKERSQTLTFFLEQTHGSYVCHWGPTKPPQGGSQTQSQGGSQSHSQGGSQSQPHPPAGVSGQTPVVDPSNPASVSGREGPQGGPPGVPEGGSQGGLQGGRRGGPVGWGDQGPRPKGGQAGGSRGGPRGVSGRGPLESQWTASTQVAAAKLGIPGVAPMNVRLATNLPPAGADEVRNQRIRDRLG